MDSYWSPTGVLESSRNRWRSEKYCLRTTMVSTCSSVSLSFFQPLTKPTLTISKTLFVHVRQSLHMVVPRPNQHNSTSCSFVLVNGMTRWRELPLRVYELHVSEFCSASQLSTISILNNHLLTSNGSPCSPLLTPSLACLLWSHLLAINVCMARSSRLTRLSGTVTLCPSLVDIKICHGPLTTLLTAVQHFTLVLIVISIYFVCSNSAINFIDKMMNVLRSLSHVQPFGISKVMMATQSMWLLGLCGQSLHSLQ